MMYFSSLTLPWLIATSVSAIPIQSQCNHGSVTLAGAGKHATNLHSPECSGLKGENVHGQGTRPSPMLVNRDIKKGWFSKEEKEKLQAASEIGVDYFELLDTLRPLSQYLDQRNINWAIAGGLALNIYGQPNRSTTDIDIVVQTDMSKLKTVFGKDLSFILPEPKTILDKNTHLRVYHNQGTTTRPKYIEIDMVIAGSRITPSNLAGNTADFEKITSDNKKLTVHALVLGKIFQSKVHALAATNRNKDDKDMEDVSYIIDKHPQALTNVQKDLSLDMRKLVVTHLIRLKSPLVNKARKLLGIPASAGARQ